MKDVWERVEDLEAIVDDLHEKSEEFDKLIPVLLEYNRLRDEEWEFEDAHGNRDFWDEETCSQHSDLLLSILKKRREVENYLRIITENPDLKF